MTDMAVENLTLNARLGSQDAHDFIKARDRLDLMDSAVCDHLDGLKTDFMTTRAQSIFWNYFRGLPVEQFARIFIKIVPVIEGCQTVAEFESEMEFFHTVLELGGASLW